MPHIIVEYSQNLSSSLDVSSFVKELHQTLTHQGIDGGRIKSRAIAIQDFVAGDKDAFVHISFCLLQGRDLETKQSYAQPLFECAKNTIEPITLNCALSMEVREMNKDTYYQ